MSLNEYQGAVWAFRELMKRAEQDIEAGRAEGARIIEKAADRTKLAIRKAA